MTETIHDEQQAKFPVIFPKENYQTPEQTLKTVNKWKHQVRGTEDPVSNYQELFIEINFADQLKGTCTDERDIVERTENDKYFRLEAVKGEINLAYRQKILNTAEQYNLHLLNHRDNVHGSTENPVGCGYLGLLAMDEAEDVFGFSLKSSDNKVSGYIQKMEQDLGVRVITLNGEHVAQNGGLLINVNSNSVLNPEGNAQNSFFSLDLGLLNLKIKEMAAELNLSEDEQQQVLINITRDNMAACYVLSNGNIDAEKFIITGNVNESIKTIIEEAYRQLTESERMEAMNAMINKRKHSTH